MYTWRHSKDTADVIAPLLGKVFIVGKRERISRDIWMSLEQRERETYWVWQGL